MAQQTPADSLIYRWYPTNTTHPGPHIGGEAFDVRHLGAPTATASEQPSVGEVSYRNPWIPTVLAGAPPSPPSGRPQRPSCRRSYSLAVKAMSAPHDSSSRPDATSWSTSLGSNGIDTDVLAGYCLIPATPVWRRSSVATHAVFDPFRAAVYVSQLTQPPGPTNRLFKLVESIQVWIVHPLAWVSVRAAGAPPSPRYGHSACMTECTIGWWFVRTIHASMTSDLEGPGFPDLDQGGSAAEWAPRSRTVAVFSTIVVV